MMFKTSVDRFNLFHHSEKGDNTSYLDHQSHAVSTGIPNKRKTTRRYSVLFSPGQRVSWRLTVWFWWLSLFSADSQEWYFHICRHLRMEMDRLCPGVSSVPSDRVRVWIAMHMSVPKGSNIVTGARFGNLKRSISVVCLGALGVSPFVVGEVFGSVATSFCVAELLAAL